MANAPQDGTDPVYPGTCQALNPRKSGKNIEDGKPHTWRLDSRKTARIHGELFFNDVGRGQTKVEPSINGDVVLARKDVGIAYHLAVVVDDEFQGITHVTRGEDLFNSTHVHRQLQAILGYREPIYHHHKLITDQDGKRLAKRHHSLALETLREKGFSPEDVMKMIS